MLKVCLSWRRFESVLDVNRAIQPIGLGHRSMAIDHYGPAAIFRSPVVENWRAKFVSLTRGLAIERKISNLTA